MADTKSRKDKREHDDISHIFLRDWVGAEGYFVPQVTIDMWSLVLSNMKSVVKNKLHSLACCDDILERESNKNSKIGKFSNNELERSIKSSFLDFVG